MVSHKLNLLDAHLDVSGENLLLHAGSDSNIEKIFSVNVGLLLEDPKADAGNLSQRRPFS